ncbi:hypothetical protein [Paenibacillus sp. UNC496MF]|uniref:hypothetical protein n=1 Tax=Paenibacillus sp. UNC496MF TaxID=1502753 RepID=UPI001160764E|nr:hypothetical protein [Paenibacillus sp. UNC496MF]
MTEQQRISLDVFRALAFLCRSLYPLYDGVNRYAWRQQHLLDGTVSISHDDFGKIVYSLVTHGYVEYHAGKGLYRPATTAIQRMEEIDSGAH